MKNITSRLTKLEVSSAKTSLVNIELMNGEAIEMDLLQAINLFLLGDVYKITRILKPDEQRQYTSRIIQEVESYINMVTEGSQELEI